METPTYKISEDLDTFRWNLQILISDEIVKMIYGFDSRDAAENYFRDILNDSRKLIEYDML